MQGACASNQSKAVVVEHKPPLPVKQFRWDNLVARAL
jgi:hypothetical protein